MKNIIIIISLLFIITSCETKKVVIEGTIKGFKVEDEIITQFTSPKVGSNWFFKDEIDVDSTGYFRIEIPTDKTIFVGLHIKWSLISFIAEGGEVYKLDIDLSTDKAKINIQGKNQEGIDLMNTYAVYSHLQIMSQPYMKGATFVDAITKVQEEKEEVLAELKQLYDTKKISKSFYELATLDREFYYKAVIAKVAQLESFKYFNKEKEVPENVVAYLNEVLVDANASKYVNSQWWNQFSEIAISYKVSRIISTVGRDSFMEEIGTDKYNTFKISLAEELFLEKKLLEVFTANAIYDATFQTSSKFDKELLDNFTQFEVDFPNSKYAEYIRPNIDRIKEYYKKIEGDYSENVKFVQDSDQINSFEELISLFKGKKLYIDIWATWCGPCKEQFKHGKDLKKLLADKDVEILYISVDRDSYHQKWKDNIKFFELDGNHIRVDQLLKKSIYSLYGGGIGLPKYIIVDENGKIEDLNAPRPSQIDELRNKL